MMSALGINADELRDAMHIITSLNPKPGSLVTGGSSDRTRHIIPDFNVEADPDNGNITLTLLNRIPELQIEATFSEEACEVPSNASRSQREAATFIKQKRDEASSFIKILKMRQDTLYRVMSAIDQAPTAHHPAKAQDIPRFRQGISPFPQVLSKEPPFWSALEKQSFLQAFR